MRRNKLQVNIARLMMVCLALVLLLPLVPAASAASGTCEDGISWELNGGVLTISGSGAMMNYSEQKPAPWQEYKDLVRAVYVQEGVTAIGDCAFLAMGNLTAVTLPESVITIGAWAFSRCHDLVMLELGGVEVIEQSAFERCLALVSVRLPDTLYRLQERAFYACSSLVSITVPASVVFMDTEVFAHCKALQNATVLAGISELPNWTFYNCENLATVTMSPTIEGVGYDAFFDCAVEKPTQGHVGLTNTTSTNTQEQDGASITTSNNHTENQNGTITTQTVTTRKDSEKTVDVTVDAVLENSKGWQDVQEKVDAALKGADKLSADVWLKGDATVSGEDLGRFAGKNVNLTIHTTQGAEWYIDGKQLTDTKLAQSYDLSYTLKELTEPDKDQAEALSGHKGYTIQFHGVLDFKVEVKIGLPREYARQSAVFFTPEKSGYQRRQAVMIDSTGIAHFYLGQVDENVEYLIGINVPQKVEQGNQNPVSDVIIPNSMKTEFPQLEQVEEIEYVVTGTKSSLGINIGQLTLILVAVMVTSAVVIAIVMRINFKQKLKAGYVPDMSYEDEE